MSTRKVKKRRLKKYSIGDFNNQLRMHVRAITSPNFDTAAFTEEYDKGIIAWCNVTTFDAGEKIFDKIDLENQPTHLFVVRYRSWITSEIIVEWKDNHYKIMKVVDPEERNEYSELYSTLLGDKELQANQ